MADRKQGFTLVEIVIVTALTALVVAVTVPIYRFFQTLPALDAVQSELLQHLRLAQVQAQAREYDTAYGVYIGSQSYTVYRGASYGERDVPYDRTFAYGQSITATPQGFVLDSYGGADVHFASDTGFPVSIGTILLTHAADRSSRAISINEVGLIQVERGGTAQMLAAGDASLLQAAPTTNTGTSTTLQVYPWTPSYSRRAVLRFPLERIPRGAVVHSANVRLHAAQTYGAPRTIAFHRILQPWSELGVTWRNTGMGAWSVQGGTYDPVAVSAQALHWTGVLGWSEWDVTSSVQQFVDGGVTNYGWLMKDQNEDTSQGYWYFGSRESGDAPTLLVEYDF